MFFKKKKAPLQKAAEPAAQNAAGQTGNGDGTKAFPPRRKTDSVDAGSGFSRRRAAAEFHSRLPLL